MSQHTNAKRAIAKALRDAGWIVTAYQPGSSGVADLLCCATGGQYFEVEVKTGAAVLTRLQRLRSTKVNQRGGRHVVMRSAAEAREFAANWARTVRMDGGSA